MIQIIKLRIFVTLITSLLLFGCNSSNDPTDTDGDGFPDNSDSFPSDKSEWVDTDGDLIGNNADPDDDGDGVADACDICAGSPDGVDGDGDGVPDRPVPGDRAFVGVDFNNAPTGGAAPSG